MWGVDLCAVGMVQPGKEISANGHGKRVIGCETGLFAVPAPSIGL
jgi:hypothetical protein